MAADGGRGHRAPIDQCVPALRVAAPPHLATGPLGLSFAAELPAIGGFIP